MPTLLGKNDESKAKEAAEAAGRGAAGRGAAGRGAAAGGDAAGGVKKREKRVVLKEKGKK